MVIAFLSFIITHYVGGPQYFTPKIFPNHTGVLEIGTIYGNIETTVMVGKVDFRYPLLISLDNQNWIEIPSVKEIQPNVFKGDFARLANLNIEKGGVLRFFLKPYSNDVSDEGSLVFGVSAFSIFERNPQRLLLFFAIFGFLLGIYKFFLKKKI